MKKNSLPKHSSLDRFRTLGAACLLFAFAATVSAQTTNPSFTLGPSAGQFNLKLDAGAIVTLRRTDDRVDTDYIQAGQRLGDVFLRYRGKDGAWVSADTAQLSRSGVGTFALNQDGRSYSATYQVLYSPPGSNTGLANTRATPMPVLTVQMQYTIQERAIVWTLTIQNAGNASREIDDLGIPLPISSSAPSGTNRPLTVLKHSFVSGYDSYMFWMRSNLVGPYLVLTPLENTKFEYWDVQRPAESAPGTPAGRGIYRVYIHSAAAGTEAKAKGTRWRQPNTNLKLAPKGEPGDTV